MYPRAPRLAALILLGLLPLGSLSACGGGDSQAEPPPLSLTPSATPTSTAPTVAPPGETARQFINRLNDLERLAENSGDTSGYRAVTQGCKPCKAFADQVDRIYARGGRIDFAGKDLVAFRVVPSVAGTTVAEISCDVGKTTYRTRRDGPEKHFAGGRRNYQMTLVRSSGAWNLQNYYLRPS